jgi:hypothetical protein
MFDLLLNLDLPLAIYGLDALRRAAFLWVLPSNASSESGSSFETYEEKKVIPIVRTETKTRIIMCIMITTAQRG